MDYLKIFGKCKVDPNLPPIIRDIQVTKDILVKAFHANYMNKIVIELENVIPCNTNINGTIYNIEIHGFDTLEELVMFVYHYDVIIIYTPKYNKEHILESIRPIKDRYVIAIFVPENINKEKI